MNFKGEIVLFWFLTLCNLQAVQGQNAPGSLKGKSLKYLNNNILKNFEEPTKAKPYVDAYLKKAKQKKVDSLILVGYFYSGYISDYEAALAYNDSIISYNTPSNPLLGSAYDEKGYLYFSKSYYKKSLESYLKAREIAKKSQNENFLFASTLSIGVIKSLIGQKEEALEVYKKQVKSFSADSFSLTNFLYKLHFHESKII